MKSKERVKHTKTLGAVLQGGSHVRPNYPIELLVSVPIIPARKQVDIPREPFWVYTSRLVEQIKGEGVRLRGGVMLPWDSFTTVGSLVIVKLWPKHSRMRPIVDLNSLLKKS